MQCSFFNSFKKKNKPCFLLQVNGILISFCFPVFFLSQPHPLVFWLVDQMFFQAEFSFSASLSLHFSSFISSAVIMLLAITTKSEDGPWTDYLSAHVDKKPFFYEFLET